MKKGSRMKDSNRKIKKERNTHKSNSFKLNFDVKKFLRITSKTLATTWIVALVLLALFVVLVTPAVFDILNVRNAADAATHNIHVSAEEVAEARLAYSNKVQHYVECTNNMQNMNLLSKIQNSAISSIAGMNIAINKNIVITVTSPAGHKLDIKSVNAQTKLDTDYDIFNHLDDQAAVDQFIREHSRK